jgi:MFS family permease
VPPLTALVLPYVVSSPQFSGWFTNSLTLPVLFGLAYVALGVTLAGQARSNFGYLAEAAPERSRAAYAAIANTLLAVVAFIPVLGGVIIERNGYDALLLTATGLGLLAVFASGALTDAHVRTRRSTQSWRIRRANGGPRQGAVRGSR